MVHAETKKEVNTMPTEKDLDQFEELMFEILSQTQKTGLEHGFDVCKENDNLKLGPTCKGTNCEVRVKGCQWPNTFLQVHTHPPGSGLILSPQDIQTAIAASADFMCVGTMPSRRSKKGAFQCYKVNQVPSNKKFIDAWWTTQVTEPKPTPEKIEKAHAYLREEIFKILVDESNMLEKSKRFNMILKGKY
jgi:hypothetical protein